jgi:hypothetical protein
MFRNEEWRMRGEFGGIPHTKKILLLIKVFSISFFLLLKSSNRKIRLHTMDQLPRLPAFFLVWSCDCCCDFSCEWVNMKSTTSLLKKDLSGVWLKQKVNILIHVVPDNNWKTHNTSVIYLVCIWNQLICFHFLQNQLAKTCFEINDHRIKYASCSNNED